MSLLRTCVRPRAGGALGLLLPLSVLPMTVLPIAEASAKEITLAVVERASSDATIQTGGEGDKVGNMLTFANEVYDAADKKKVGSDNGFCIRTVTGKAWLCEWTLVLAEGQINVNGPFTDEGDSVLTVTGGTGSYAGATGEMDLHPRDAKGSAYDFVYRMSKP